MFQPIYKQIIEDYIQAYNDFDIDRMMINMDQTIEYEHQVNGRILQKITGFREFKDYAELVGSTYLMRELKPISWKFEGNTVKVEMEFKGEFAIDYREDLAIGDKIESKGESEFIFFQNKIIQIIDKIKI